MLRLTVATVLLCAAGAAADEREARALAAQSASVSAGVIETSAPTTFRWVRRGGAGSVVVDCLGEVPRSGGVP